MNNNIVLIIGLVWPEPKSSAAGQRMLQLIKLFQASGYTVVFASTALNSEFNFDLSSINVQTAAIELNADSFDYYIKELNPTFVLFDRFITEEQFGWRVSSNCSTAIKILDSEDLHCLRYTRSSNFKKGIAFKPENLFVEEWTKREIASILRCDLTLIIAEFEMELLKRYFKIDEQLLFYLPLLFESRELSFDKLNSFEKRKDFVFIGNFWHEPNWDAVLYLKQTIWPIIRKQLPDANIKIYGAYPSQKVFDLHNKKEGFLIEGRADVASTVISTARVLLAPLRFGAGIKGKLLEAMQFGTPSVTSTIGAESINGEYPWNGFICNDAVDFASKAVFIYENEAIWSHCQDYGKTVLERRFSWSHFEDLFVKRLQFILGNVEVNRNNNFYGALLAHHSMKSTEYLSRWIQEKNKQEV